METRWWKLNMSETQNEYKFFEMAKWSPSIIVSVVSFRGWRDLPPGSLRVNLEKA